MTHDIEKEAQEYADRAYTLNRMERTDRKNDYLAGAKAERRWWASRWREYSRLCQLPKDMSQQEIYKGRSAIIDELDQAAEGK